MICWCDLCVFGLNLWEQWKQQYHTVNWPVCVTLRIYPPGFARAVVDLLPCMQKDEKQGPFDMVALMQNQCLHVFTLGNSMVSFQFPAAASQSHLSVSIERLQDHVEPEKVRYHFRATPWSEWEDAQLLGVLEYLAKSNLLSIPEEWKDSLPALFQWTIIESQALIQSSSYMGLIWNCDFTRRNCDFCRSNCDFWRSSFLYTFLTSLCWQNITHFQLLRKAM